MHNCILTLALMKTILLNQCCSWHTVLASESVSHLNRPHLARLCVGPVHWCLSAKTIIFLALHASTLWRKWDMCLPCFEGDVSQTSTDVRSDVTTKYNTDTVWTLDTGRESGLYVGTLLCSGSSTNSRKYVKKTCFHKFYVMLGLLFLTILLYLQRTLSVHTIHYPWEIIRAKTGVRLYHTSIVREIHQGSVPVVFILDEIGMHLWSSELRWAQG